MAGIAFLLYGAIVYLIFFGTLLYVIAFLSRRVQPRQR